MLPYDCDALLPELERFASPKFRRYAQWFRPTKMDFADAVELVSFVKTIGGPKLAGPIFHWGKSAYKAYERLATHPPILEYALAGVDANMAAMTPRIALRILGIARESGFRGRIPGLYQKAVAELYRDGVKVAELQRLTGLKRHQLEWMWRPKTARRIRANAAASLAVG